MIWLILIHLLIVAILFVCRAIGFIKTRENLMPVVFFVPFVGAVLLLIYELRERRNKVGHHEIGLEKMKIENVKYKRIDIDREDSRGTIPLEEALSMNDTRTRRELMLDILQKNPHEFMALLQEARTAEDTEITHYATTTMMELQSEYEKNIHSLALALERDKKSLPFWKRYAEELEEYTGSGLISDTILRIYRERLNNAYENLNQLDPDNKGLLLRYFNNLIETGRETQAQQILQHLEELWGNDEDICMAKFTYFREGRRRNEMQAVLQKMQREQEYLTPYARVWLEFWSGGRTETTA